VTTQVKARSEVHVESLPDDQAPYRKLIEELRETGGGGTHGPPWHREAMNDLLAPYSSLETCVVAT
jgi:hypothetical protein